MFISKFLSSVISLKKALSFGVFLFLFVSESSGFTITNNDEEADSLGAIPTLADPCLLEYRGKYYLYGTSDKAQEGFKVYMSADLKNWSGAVGARNGYALHKEDAWGDRSFWAPQVFRYRNKFYMAYAANESIAIAESDSPWGPFTQKVKQALSAPVKQIDPYIFIDDDGKKYLYHVRVANGGNRIFVAELTNDFDSIKPETLRECISATEEWENAEHAKWSVAEGPAVLKHKGLYYLIYSTNHFKSINYAVGYAVSKSPFGPWQKYAGNPILSRLDVNENGTGHGDFVKDNQGNLLYVFHTHFSNTSIAPRKTAVVKAGFSNDPSTGIDNLRIEAKSFYYLNLKR